MNPSFITFCLSLLLTGRIVLAATVDVEKHSLKMKKMVASATDTLMHPMATVDKNANTSDWGNATWFWLYQTHHNGKHCDPDRTIAQVINTFSQKCQGSDSPSLELAGVKLPEGAGSTRVRCAIDGDNVVLQARVWDNEDCSGKWQDTTSTILNSAKCEVETAGDVFGISTGDVFGGSASFNFGCAPQGDWPQNLTAINACYWSTYLSNGYVESDLTALGRCDNGTTYADAYAAFDSRTLKRLGLASELGCGNAITDKCRKDDMFHSGGWVAGRAGNLTTDPTKTANNDNNNAGGGGGAIGQAQAEMVEQDADADEEEEDSIGGPSKWLGDLWSNVKMAFA